MVRRRDARRDVKQRIEAGMLRFGAVGPLAINASSGDVEPLSEYLRSDRPLSEEDRKWLAWLIDWQWRKIDELRPRPRGRPDGTGITPRAEAMHCVVCIVSSWKEIWCRIEPMP
jgi:hypothetical protein